MSPDADSPPDRPPLERARDGLGQVGEALTRNRIRIGLLIVILFASGVIAVGATGDGLSTASAADAPEAPQADNITVITESGRAGTLIAYNPDGSILYYADERTKYFDVDQVEGTTATVEYVATDTLHTSGPYCDSPPCARNVIERTNLTTGETEVIVERYNHQETAGEWHDHVRVNETRVLIADILYDRVYMLNTETGIIEWEWDAQADFDPADSGGSFMRDWTHLNDVSLLDDGRIMASLRNHDRVVFIDPKTGVQEDWTLGEENNYDILYEQHNPDYIPESAGGPAVVVADSENNRIKEFQREDGEWVQSWEWTSSEMRWPRDADRLPNGNTLITDTHGNRVIEVNPEGEVVWEVGSTLPYEAERLNTGVESQGGESAQRLGLESRTERGATSDDGGGGFDPLTGIGHFLEGLLPHRIVNGIYFVMPVWFGAPQFAAAGLGLFAGLGWLGAELRWQLRDAGVRFRLPVYRE
ncbi:aryl-sulfate sulfotransferase [Halovenus halobia]|uniref:aryl-sulfate sulfotransferase n=1 Tax=Halovenus halobia TaxID=3396622 RepID=UPI003F554D4C